MRAPAAERIINTLGLVPLPEEGGFFRATWRSATASAIYFLLTQDDFSALHRLAQDETWHFYAGDPVEHVQLDPRDGGATVRRMGPDIEAGEEPQVHVPAGMWQGARLAAGTAVAPNSARLGEDASGRTAGAWTGRGFALLGCTVSPPWEKNGSTMAEREDLRRAFPAHAGWIDALTR